MLCFDGTESSDAGTDIDPYPLRILLGDPQAGTLDSNVAGRDSVEDEKVHLARILGVHVGQRIEVLDLGGDSGGEVTGVKASDGTHSTLALKQTTPRTFRVQTQGRDQPYACQHDPSFQGELQDLFLMSVDVVDGVLHGLNLFSVLVRNLNIEVLFKFHHQFHRIQRVRSKVIYKMRIGGHISFVGPQLIHNDRFHAYFY